MNTENELFGELHEQEENGLFGNEHRRQHEAQHEALRLSAVRRSLNIINFIICEVKADTIIKLNTKNFTTKQAAITWLQYHGMKNIKYCIIEEVSLY